MLEGLQESFFSTFKQLIADGNEIIIVHGGGPAINQALADKQVTSTTINGFRVTSEEAVLDLVEKAILLFRDKGIAGERFSHTVERLGFEETCALLESDELLQRKEEILSK